MMEGENKFTKRPQLPKRRSSAAARELSPTTTTATATWRQTSALIPSSTAHDFGDLTTFFLPCLCRCCREVIWGFAFGFQCRKCSACVHQECRADTPKDCNVLAQVRQEKAISPKVSFNRKGIIKEGFLWKMSKVDTSWTRLWCTCKPEALFVFRPEKRLLEYKNPILVISLNEELSVANVQALRENCFFVDNGVEFHYFSAESDQERKEWKYAIKHKKPKACFNTGTQEGEESLVGESWIWTLAHPEPVPYSWEDVKPVKVKLLDLVAIEMKAPNPRFFVPELEIKSEELTLDKAEVFYFRTKVDRVVKKLQQQNKNRERLILAEITDAPLPAKFPSAFLVRFCHSDQPGVRIPCQKDSNLKDILLRDVIARLVPMNMSVSWTMPMAEDYMVRCGKMNEYITDVDVTLQSIVYVRDALSKGQQIEFYLIPLAQRDDFSSGGGSSGGEPASKERLPHTFCSVEADEQLLDFHTDVYNCYPVSKVRKQFDVKIRHVENMTKQILYDSQEFFSLDIEGDRVNIFVGLSIIYGEQQLTSVLHTQPVSPDRPVWEDWLVAESLTMENIPHEARLYFTLYACKAQGGGVIGLLTNLVCGANQLVPLASCDVTYADFRGQVRRSTYNLPMWLFAQPPEKQQGRPGLVLVVEFDSSPPNPITFLQPIPEVNGGSGDMGGKERLTATEGSSGMVSIEPSLAEQKHIYILVRRDPLYTMSAEEKALLWKYRMFIRSQLPHALSKVLVAAPSCESHVLSEIHSLVASWPTISPVNALELLGPRFADMQVRQFAVDCLRELTDRQLVEYLPQLIQVLKFEPHHYSALFEFLLLRSTQSVALGHPFFWHLTAEWHTSTNKCLRFKLMIEAFLTANDAEMAEELKRELHVVAKFANLAKQLKQTNKEERTAVLRAKLKQLLLPKSFLLPYNPKFEAVRLIESECKVMDSMTSPLWLVFENSEKQKAQIIFKVGDDLRTDILSLQMIRIMDQLWRNEGLDLHMQPYRAMSTGKEEGIIEVVTNSETTSAISQRYGGGGAMSAYSRESLAHWLKACNPTETGLRAAIENFTLSCAGYCVATYILGVGDRHNDNIMITYSGNLFHIDFAYFLGRRVTFAGVIPRETTPFVLTPDFVEAMGGTQSANFQAFVVHCCRAYNILRKHAHLFITLFAMMVSSGISQLRSPDDLEYLRHALALELTEEEATQRFQRLIQESLNNNIVQLNNAVHMLART